MATIRLPPKDRREQSHHGRPVDRTSVVKPGAITRDAHSRMTAVRRIPTVDRRRAAAQFDGRGQFRKALAKGLKWGATLRHASRAVGEGRPGW